MMNLWNFAPRRSAWNQMSFKIFNSDTVSSQISSAPRLCRAPRRILFPPCLWCHSKYSPANLSIYIQQRLQSKEEESQRKRSIFQFEISAFITSLSLPLCLPLFHSEFLFSLSLAVELGTDKWKIEKGTLRDGKRVQRRQILNGGIGSSMEHTVGVCVCVSVWNRNEGKQWCIWKFSVTLQTL